MDISYGYIYAINYITMVIYKCNITFCMNKYLFSDVYLFVPHNRDGSIQVIKTTTPNTITVVNTSLFVY